MNRRSFLTGGAAGLLLARPGLAAPRLMRRAHVSLDNRLRIEWRRPERARLFDNVLCEGRPLLFRGGYGLLTAATQPEQAHAGPLETTFTHRLRKLRSAPGEDVLEGELVLRNTGSKTVAASVTFATSAHPARSYSAERVHLPLTAGPHSVLRELGMTAMLDCEMPATRAAAFYLEPGASDPQTTTTPRLLLIPLACRSNAEVPWSVSMFGSPERPWKFHSVETAQGETGWLATTRIELRPQQEVVERFYLYLHEGGARVAWKAFHTLAHPDREPRPAWLDEVKVHYYDFFSPGGAHGQRGLGYDEDAEHFRQFSVGLATQHGYYPHWGDYIHPARKTWPAMPSDRNGPAPMSIDKLRERCRRARAAGARAALYIHAAGFDSASPLAPKLADAVPVAADGARRGFPWDGPDVAKPNPWHMSIAAPAWREHLLQQTRWIMELVAPDAIVVDETFAGVGYDYHPSRRGPLSPHMIQWMKDLRKLAHSFGPDKALLTSDCSLGSFVLWADGDAGDHAYHSLLGNDLYRREPVRYLAALGDKPWLPCAWNTQLFWALQLDLARKTGAGVGVGNGWLEYSGLAGLSPSARRRMLDDIALL